MNVSEVSRRYGVGPENVHIERSRKGGMLFVCSLPQEPSLNQGESIRTGVDPEHIAWINRTYLSNSSFKFEFNSTGGVRMVQKPSEHSLILVAIAQDKPEEVIEYPDPMGAIGLQRQAAIARIAARREVREHSFRYRLGGWFREAAHSIKQFIG